MASPTKRPNSFTDALYQSGPEFDFYQAVRLLELLHHDPADSVWAAVEDVARFRAHQSLNFPPSAIYTIDMAMSVSISGGNHKASGPRL